MGGTLLLEAWGDSCPGSTGTLAGFFVGMDTQAACIAGFQVTAQQGTGAVTLQPLIQGSAVGTAYAINPAYQYTLRVRVHCPENERELAIYRSFGDSGAITAGGQWNTAPGNMQMEIQQFVNGVGGMPVTLYDGAIAAFPELQCGGREQHQSDWNHARAQFDQSRLGLGGEHAAGRRPYTRRVGTTAEAAECHLERTGKWCFTPGLRRWWASRLR
jgi:hypothetical protein